MADHDLENTTAAQEQEDVPFMPRMDFTPEWVRKELRPIALSEDIVEPYERPTFAFGLGLEGPPLRLKGCLGQAWGVFERRWDEGSHEKIPCRTKRMTASFTSVSLLPCTCATVRMNRES
ncbi:MAG: hypothetical protein K6U10_02415 [Acidobacteriia bacterium]|nr:hypothetical protein [Methyloceanibacter sp.]MCL6490655.1 hypothetical protein [Terriglobia bacterium]